MGRLWNEKDDNLISSDIAVDDLARMLKRSKQTIINRRYYIRAKVKVSNMDIDPKLLETIKNSYVNKYTIAEISKQVNLSQMIVGRIIQVYKLKSKYKNTCKEKRNTLEQEIYFLFNKTKIRNIKEVFQLMDCKKASEKDRVRIAIIRLIGFGKIQYYKGE